MENKNKEPLHPGYSENRYQAFCDIEEATNNGQYKNPLVPISFFKNRYEAICAMTEELNAKCDNNPKHKVTSLAKWRQLLNL